MQCTFSLHNEAKQTTPINRISTYIVEMPPACCKLLYRREQVNNPSQSLGKEILLAMAGKLYVFGRPLSLTLHIHILPNYYHSLTIYSTQDYNKISWVTIRENKRTDVTVF